MSWFKIAADLIRDAMSSGESSEQPQADPVPPADIAGLIGFVNRHRAEIDKNFEIVAQMLKVQNERHLRAMQIQRRWNYGLTAALVLVAILAVASYLRG